MPFREDADLVLGPTTKHRWAYACSKAIDEFLALAYWKERKLPVIIVRFFNTVGPAPDRPVRHGDPEFRAPGAGRRADHGLRRRHAVARFTHVGDVVGALMKLIDEPTAIGQVINIGNTEEVTITRLAERVRDLSGSNSTIKYDPVRRGLRIGLRGHAAPGAGSHQDSLADRLRAQTRAQRHPCTGHRLLQEKVACWAWIGPRPRVYWIGPYEQDEAPRRRCRGFALDRFQCLCRGAALHSERPGLAHREGRDRPADSHGMGAHRPDEDSQCRAHSGWPLTLELNDVTEQEALDVLLRSISGYMAAPRPRRDEPLRFRSHRRHADARQREAPGVIGHATARGTSSRRRSSSSRRRSTTTTSTMSSRHRTWRCRRCGPVFNTYPQQPQTVAPQMGQPPFVQQPNMQMPNGWPPPVQPFSSPQPAAPFGGVAVPGMVAPQPAPQPGQPGQPQPVPPGRRPGGE